MAKLFVYGTLKRGYRLNDYLNGAEFLYEATTLPKYKLYDNGQFPAIAPGKTAISGEVFEVPQKLFHLLDKLERGYRRIIDKINGEDTWIYIGGDIFDQFDFKATDQTTY